MPSGDMAHTLANHGIAWDMYSGLGHPRMASESIWKTAHCGRENSGHEPQAIRFFYANDANVRSLLQKAHMAAAEAELHVLLLHVLRGLAKRAISSPAQS